jgi:hypothetical protein
MCEFVAWCKLPAVIVQNAALCLFEILPDDRNSNEEFCKAFSSRIPNSVFLDCDLWGVPEMNLANRLSEVLLVEERNGYQRVS